MQPLDPLALKLDNTILIEAGAGTGKTYTIALLYLRLLLERGLSIDQILVVTFTKAATEELRGRIRLRIREALDVLDNAGPDDPLLHELVDAAGDPAQARILLADALTRMDEAAIFTIHGFCQRMLQEHAFESGAPFEMEFLESEQLLRLQIMEDFWRRRFYPAPSVEAVWATSCWATPRDLLNALGGHLSRPSVRCVPVLEEEELARQQEELQPLFARVRQMWLAQGQEIAEQLRTNKRLKRGLKDGYHLDRIELMVEEMDGFVQGEEMSWLLSKDMEFFTRTKIEACLTVRGKAEPPDHPFHELFDEFFRLHREMTRCREIAVLLAGREYLHTELARRKLRQAQLYFDDLLIQLDEALAGSGGDRLARSISERFPAMLVDEFQDTDPLQYRIFSRIHAAGSGSGLFLIGDPKQAIYGFRGADIFTYIQARRNTAADNRFTMTTNYRSTSPMVEAVNRLFERDNPFFFDQEAIDFTPVAASGLADDKPLRINGSRPAPLTCLLLEQTADGKALGKQKAREQAAELCALEIARLMLAGRSNEALIGERPLGAGDIAILVRTHDEAEIIRRALARRSISSVYISRESVFAGSEAEQMLILLQGLLNLSDAPLVRRVLATDLFGRTALELEEMHDNEELWQQATAELADYLALWQQKGFLPMFQRLLTRQRLVARIQAEENGERRLTNFLHLAELLQQAEKQEPGPDGLLRRLSRQILDPDNQVEAMQLRLESDENLVKIVTIHKAKGLEYPLVFLPFLWSARPCKKDEPLVFHRKDDPETLYIDLGTGDAQNYQLAENERLAEDLRLLYVAVTRARYGCFFCWGRIARMNESALCYLLHDAVLPDPQQHDEQLAACIGDDNIRPFPGELPDLVVPPESSAEKPEAMEFRGHIDTSWQITSYSRLTAGSDSRPEQPDYDRQDETTIAAPGHDVFGFPRGAAAGTCLHAIFERIDFTDPAGCGEVIRDQLERAGIDSSWVEVVEAWIPAVLHTELAPGFSLSCLDERDRINEMGFYFPLAGMRLDRFNRVLDDFDIPPLSGTQERLQGLMVGFIDLVYRYEGRYFVADYKSNHLGGTPEDYGPDNLHAAMLEHRYDLQYLIYTVALHRYLARRMDDYDYELHLGGIRYLFLRGMHPEYPPGTGVLSDRPPRQLITALDRCFAGGE